MKILNIKITNFKAITDFDKQLNGASFWIAGENSLGKSTILDLIMNLRGKNLPPKPIKNGEEKASIKVVIGADGKQYEIERTFTKKSKTGYLRITSEDGMSTTQLSFLENLIGKPLIDPFEFVELSQSISGRREQVKVIRELLNDEENTAISNVEDDMKKAMDRKNELNQQIKTRQVLLNDYDLSEDQIKAGGEVIPVTKKQEAIKELKDQGNQDFQHRHIYEVQVESRKKAEEELKKLKEVEANLKKKVDKMKSQKDFRNEIDNLEEQLQKDQESNQKVEQVSLYVKLKEQQDNDTREAKKKKDRVNELQDKKAQIIKKSSIPIEGLTFNEDGLELNGIPFHQDQVATSDVMEVALKINAAQNPRLKFIPVKRGESLGQDKIDFLKELSKTHQIFVEQVERGTEKLEVRVFE